jgi:hypothetical protein
VAITDDLRSLEATDVLYLALQDAPRADGFRPTLIYRGRLRQALSGNWVFDASTGANGVAAVILGTEGDTWTSSDSPAAGLQVTIEFPGTLGSAVVGAVIPADLVT